jgi:hypothetical protein
MSSEEIKKLKVNLRAANKRVDTAKSKGDLRKYKNAKLSQQYWTDQLKSS